MEESEFLNKFNQLEDIEVVDTYALEAINQANAIKQIIQDVYSQGPLSAQGQEALNSYVQEMTDEMNEACPYLGQPVRITGEVSQAVARDGRFSVEKVQYDDELVIAHGYTVQAALGEDGSDERQLVVAHVFHVHDLNQMPTDNPLVQFTPHIFALAPTGSVEISAELPNAMNIERLLKTVPKTLEQIDTILAATDTEGEAVMALAALSIDHQQVPKESQSDLLSYVGRRIELDRQAPYHVVVRGPVLYTSRFDADEQHVKVFDASENLLITSSLLALNQLPALDEDDNLCYSSERHWMVRARLIEPIPGGPEMIVTIPAASIRQMTSVRDLVYADSLSVQD